MNYKNLIEYIKIAYENVWTMHHYVVSPNFFSDHEKLGDYYELLGKYRDELIEAGLSMEIKVDEPTIIEALNTYKGKFELLPSKDITAKDCFTKVKEYFDDIIYIIDEIKSEQVGFIVSKLEEIQYELNIESMYKLPRLIQGK